MVPNLQVPNSRTFTKEMESNRCLVPCTTNVQMGRWKGLSKQIKKGYKWMLLSMVKLKWTCTIIYLLIDPTPSPVTGKTLAELFIGRKVRFTLDLIKPDVKVFENEFTEVVDRHFKSNDKVFVRNYATKEKWVPGIIIRRIGSRLYKVKVNDVIVKQHLKICLI